MSSLIQKVIGADTLPLQPAPREGQDLAGWRDRYTVLRKQATRLDRAIRKREAEARLLSEQIGDRLSTAPRSRLGRGQLGKWNERRRELTREIDTLQGELIRVIRRRNAAFAQIQELSNKQPTPRKAGR